LGEDLPYFFKNLFYDPTVKAALFFTHFPKSTYGWIANNFLFFKLPSR
jgi:hypothetical protein